MHAGTFLPEIQPLQTAGGVANGRQDRPFAFLERQALAKRPGHHEDVAEQDGRIETETANGLEGHFSGKWRRWCRG